MVVLEIMEGGCWRSVLLSGGAATLACTVTHTFTFTIYSCSQERCGAVWLAVRTNQHEIETWPMLNWYSLTHSLSNHLLVCLTCLHIF